MIDPNTDLMIDLNRNTDLFQLTKIIYSDPANEESADDGA